MVNIITISKKAWEFVSQKLWHIRLDKIDKRQGFLIKQLRIFSLAVKGFNEDNCLTKASALTYYTLFSIVPVLALVFAIAKGFGFEKSLQQQLATSYSEYSDILNNAFIYADALLVTAKGGVIAGFGVILLLWSVMKLLLNIEASFNEIWEIKRGRNWVRMLTDYLTIMLVSPIFLIISGGLTVAIQTKIGSFEMLGWVSVILINVVAYGLIVCIFMFLYIVLPNTKVNTRSAFSAAVISTILFQILQWAYIKFQIGANSMNAIYGGFAALPLFLIWVQYSWYVVLFGAELAFANQNVDHYELENEIKNISIRYKKVISLMVANLVSRRFYNGEKSMTSVEIGLKLDLPLRLVRNIINEFVEAGIFVEIKNDRNKEITYQPGITESKFTVKHLFDTLEKRGVNELPVDDTQEKLKINQLMLDLDKMLDNELGQLMVKDIVK